jgi:phage replication-related protein YjqB (UPF0714/DUF867 family)
MADKYHSFEELSRSETSGIDFSISVRRAVDLFAIVAPHGGGIEPGTSELADAIAAEEFSYYAFDGLKKVSGNSVLHITSTRFDEPMCLNLIGHSEVVITIHGEESEIEGGAALEAVFLGGLDDERGSRLGAALKAGGFDVRQHPDPQLQGRERQNLCNRGISGKGVQLELSRGLRKEMFLSLSQDGREHTTTKFLEFVDALRNALHG